MLIDNINNRNKVMQANEAPEKIFLEWYRIGDEKYRDWCIVPKTNDKPVEYTRTNAFIEKACEWMSSHLQMQYDGFGSFIKDFRKAMKGD